MAARLLGAFGILMFGGALFVVYGLWAFFKALEDRERDS